MANPNVGWTTHPELSTKTESVLTNSTNKADEIKEEWINYIKEETPDSRKVEEIVFINTCVLMAIKQFVFDYFYETFQYTLVRIAFRYPHHLITQSVNEYWRVPKFLKSELKRPKPKKPKKEKVKKEKKPKQPKEKSSKKSKSTKETKEKKGKKEKPKQLTKEEKAELAKLKKEKEMEDEKKRIAELNKRFMFPLSEAATDDFYKEIFDNWVKVEKGDKGKKGKNGK
ncbi:uncharacterized protein DDB_G0286299-like [Anoplophora glabripennis]|uniref:uncharacterized protein DDB_G0286299-like n=1 Tax=Anoplophora glabripennis TaxID=217634 RepID=UPI000873E93A|nr:uncharacterized protein DDB_G0286299-like [Anoplophora glabripennis]